VSEREDFLARWSRRKRQVIEKDGIEKDGIEKDGHPPAAAASGASDCPPDGGKALATEKPLPVSSELPFDRATLPPIDSITAETDIRAFLAPGVPAETTRAALRRAWVTDAKIRDFVGLAECAWDFNTPGAVPGFGPLVMTDEWRRAIAQMLTRGQADVIAEHPVAAASEKIERAPAQTHSDQAAPPAEPRSRHQVALQGQEATPANNQEATPANNDVARRNKEDIAVQNRRAHQDCPESIVQRSHGRALPKV
jgi:hypothetical protein